MSTRCQIHVVQEGLDWEEKITLYKHSDGYPSGVVPLLKEAWERFGSSWQAGRARKVASFLCAVAPGSIEPEAGHDLHSDIDYYYVVHVMNPGGSSVAGHPLWEVEVFSTTDGWWEKERPTHGDLRLLNPRTDITKMTFVQEE